MSAVSQVAPKITRGRQRDNPLPMTAKQLLATRLLAEDDLTDEQIAKRCGCSRNALAEWKTCEEFAQAIADVRKELKERILGSGYAVREQRVLLYKGILTDLDTITEERAAHALKDPKLKKIPGSGTGRVVPTLKAVGSGPLARIVEEHVVDHGTIKAQRDTAKQLAQEVGQWIEKSDVTSGGAPLKTYIGFDPDEV